MIAVGIHIIRRYCVKLARVTNRFTLGQKAFEFPTIRLARRSWRRWIDKIELVKAMSEFVTEPAGDYMYRLDSGRNIFLSRGHALIRCRIPSLAMCSLLNRTIWQTLSPEGPFALAL